MDEREWAFPQELKRLDYPKARLLTGQLFDYDGRRTGQCSIASDSYSFPSSPNEAGVSANKIALTVSNIAEKRKPI